MAYSLVTFIQRLWYKDALRITSLFCLHFTNLQSSHDGAIMPCQSVLLRSIGALHNPKTVFCPWLCGPRLAAAPDRADLKNLCIRSWPPALLLLSSLSVHTAVFSPLSLSYYLPVWNRGATVLRMLPTWTCEMIEMSGTSGTTLRITITTFILNFVMYSIVHIF